MRAKISNHKIQEPKNKSQILKLENQDKVYDLEELTALFAERVRDFCLKLPKNAANAVYIPQLLRAGSSPGANYIEANESIGDKDFKMRLKRAEENQKNRVIGYDLSLLMVLRNKKMKEFICARKLKSWY